jgi:urease accessory protein
MLRANNHLRRGEWRGKPFDSLALDHEARHLRRRRLTLAHGEAVMVDLPDTVLLEHGDALQLDDGRLVEVVAAEEALMEVTGHSARQLTELAWHIGNRHLAAQIEEDRILILRDKVIADMLNGLGAHVREVTATFHPARGAYASDGHHSASHHAAAHGHGHHD